MAEEKQKKRNILQTDISVGVSIVDLVMLTKHFSVMLDAGLTIPEALEVVVEQATGSLKRVLKRVQKRVDGGTSLGEALEYEPKVFTPIFVSAVVIGESSGTLAENLRRLATQMNKDLELRRQIQAASIYPIIVLAAALILGLGIATFILPEVVDIFRSLRTDLPFSTKALLWVAGIFDKHGGLVSFGIIAGTVFVAYLLRRPILKPIIDRVMLWMPIISKFIHDVNRARFCRTLGTLLESGTPITEALKITQASLSNTVYKNSIKYLRKQVKTGESFAMIIQEHERLYPKMITRMTAVGEETGSLGTTYLYLASFYEERVQVVSKNLSSIIEPILLLAMGLIVGLLAISIITPIYSITSSIQI